MNAGSDDYLRKVNDMLRSRTQPSVAAKPTSRRRRHLLRIALAAGLAGAVIAARAQRARQQTAEPAWMPAEPMPTNTPAVHPPAANTPVPTPTPQMTASPAQSVIPPASATPSVPVTASVLSASESLRMPMASATAQPVAMTADSGSANLGTADLDTADLGDGLVSSPAIVDLSIGGQAPQSNGVDDSLFEPLNPTTHTSGANGWSDYAPPLASPSEGASQPAETSGVYGRTLPAAGMPDQSGAPWWLDESAAAAEDGTLRGDGLTETEVVSFEQGFADRDDSTDDAGPTNSPSQG